MGADEIYLLPPVSSLPPFYSFSHETINNINNFCIFADVSARFGNDAH